jgi:EF hand
MGRAMRRFRPFGSAVAALVLSSVLLSGGASAYTVQQARDIFDMLDTNHDGKVTKLEFETNKIDAFYFRARSDEQDPRLRFEDTGLSREFFMRADNGHKGYLTGLDLADAIHYEDIDVKHHGFFTFEDFLAGLKTISR